MENENSCQTKVVSGFYAGSLSKKKSPVTVQASV